MIEKGEEERGKSREERRGERGVRSEERQKRLRSI
jgi:hypothetical protein